MLNINLLNDILYPKVSLNALELKILLKLVDEERQIKKIIYCYHFHVAVRLSEKPPMQTHFLPKAFTKTTDPPFDISQQVVMR